MPPHPEGSVVDPDPAFQVNPDPVTDTDSVPDTDPGF
jgi:hypothetical protein